MLGDKHDLGGHEWPRFPRYRRDRPTVRHFGIPVSRLAARSFPVKDFFLILISTTLVNNFVLIKFLGICPFLGVSKRPEAVLAMGLATTFVLTLSVASSYWINTHVLEPLQLEYLRTLCFIAVIAVVVQFTELLVHRANPVLYQVLGMYLPLITTNCAILGVALLNVQANSGLVESLLSGFGAALGFTLVLVLLAGVRERVDAADVPAPFRGNAIALITAGLASLAFLGFAGLV